MNIPLANWEHVFKLDPDRSISERDLERIARSGTDAVLVGGSTGVTERNAAELLFRLRRYPLVCVQEISDERAVVPGYDFYLIPFVMNTKNSDWHMTRHHRAVKKFDGLIPWDRVAAEGYVILNPDATAARLTSAETGLDAADVAAYARMADRLFRFPVFYLEYSGTFGDMDGVRRAADLLESSRLFYGGGIDCGEKAEKAALAAHTVVVGNALYENLDGALETVEAVKNAKKKGQINHVSCDRHP